MSKRKEQPMRRKITRNSKESARNLTRAIGHERMLRLKDEVFEAGKAALDGVVNDLGRLLVEGILLMEREQIAGPDYHPISDIRKGGRQPGSVYLGQSKVSVMRPRARGSDGEIELESYVKMREKEGFSDELLAKSLRGLAGRRYQETVEETASHFGISPSTVSRHIVSATVSQLKAFQERTHADFEPFSIFLDTIHRGERAFIVALGLDVKGDKRPLGFWEGSTENSEICQELLRELERRGLVLSDEIIFVTDGGTGIIKELRRRFGGRLLLQRCTIHKLRNLERHLAKKYRKEAARLFRDALDCVQYQDAKRGLEALEKWLREINASAANSLAEARNELLTIHRLKVPELLRKTLHSTNPIESMFSTVRDCEINIKRWRTTAMGQRWLATVLLHAEKGFRRVKGYQAIDEVRKTIKKLRNESEAA
jgi:transposase-like protein